MNAAVKLCPCGKPAKKAGKCWSHYTTGATCEGPGCDRLVRRGRYCNSHHAQWRRTGHVSELVDRRGDGTRSPWDQFKEAFLDAAALDAFDKEALDKALRRMREASVRYVMSLPRRERLFKEANEVIRAARKAAKGKA